MDNINGALAFKAWRDVAEFLQKIEYHQKLL